MAEEIEGAKQETSGQLSEADVRKILEKIAPKKRSRIGVTKKAGNTSRKNRKLEKASRKKNFQMKKQVRKFSSRKGRGSK